MTVCQLYTVVFLFILIDFVNLDLTSESCNNKFNVVLFLAKTSIGETYFQDRGIKCLKFEEKQRVKHCAPGSTNDDESVSSYASLGSDCKQLLKGAIFSLISYCRNVLSMTTAIASVENDTFSNGLRFRKSTSEDLEIRYHQPRTLRGRLNHARNSKPHFITQPEHTEVFKIRTKREYRFDDVPEGQLQEEEGTPKWDIFGVVANIKLTFFGKLLENEKESQEQMPEVAPNNMMEQLGKVSENSLFDLVQESLINVQDSREGGFLIIILGGCLKEVANVYSSLMQSVKHVVENTDERNTLIVVTGSCPLEDEPSLNQEQLLIPVYVKGPPKTSSISISSQLYDVPYAIKNLLTDMNGGNYLGSIKTKRSKRDSLRTKQKRNSANRKGPFLLLLLPFLYFPY